jgi:hypothetical protein
LRYAGCFVDLITTTILSEGGKAVLTTTLKACLEKLFKRKKKSISVEEQKQIDKTAEKMIQAATWDDVLRFDTKYQTITHRSGAAKKAAPKKRVAFKKAAPKRVSVKKTAGTRSATKKR